MVEKDCEAKARKRGYNRKYRQKNKERIKICKEKYYKKNKEKIKEYLQAPEIKERIKKAGKEYRERPESKTRKKEWEKKYYQKSEVKTRKREYLKKYRQIPEFKAKMRKYKEKYYSLPENKEKMKKHRKEYCQRPEVKQRQKEYLKKYGKEYYKKNKEDIQKKSKEYYSLLKNETRRKEKDKEYYQKPETKIKVNKRVRKRRKNDKNFRTLSLLRSRFGNAFSQFSKTGKIMSSHEYGIDFKIIIKHLKPFPKNIENYEIDHVIPLSWFNFNNPKEIRWAFAPENHQWLTKKENMEKGNRYIMVAERTIKNGK